MAFGCLPASGPLFAPRAEVAGREFRRENVSASSVQERGYWQLA
jgi:hypothetical protein